MPIHAHFRGFEGIFVPKMGVNRQFQAKILKSKNRNIAETTDRINSKFEDQQLHFVGGLPLPQTNPTWRTAAILKIDMTS